MDWKERLENYVKGDHGFCGGVLCRDCPFKFKEKGCVVTDLTGAELAMVARHLIASAQDFDNNEIRARIAEMLDDDAREKFLGKAEPEPKYDAYNTVGAIVYRPHCGVDNHTPEFRYSIEGTSSHIAAFRDKGTRDRVLEFLNGEGNA